MSSTISTYIPTSGATATRNADVLPFPFPARPQVMTVYVRFVELGSVLVTNARVFQIGSVTSASPRLILFKASGGFRFQHQTLNGAVLATAAALSSIGDVMEYVCQLDTTGAVNLIQSINSAAKVTTGFSGGLTFAAAWSGPLLWLNSAGIGNIGFNAFRNIVFHRGVQTIETMRRLAGV